MLSAIGVDIGGTNIKLGLVNARGRVLARVSFLTRVAFRRRDFLDALSRHVQSLCKVAREKKLKIGGMGVGAPGPIDVERGFVYFFPNIPGWKNTPFKQLLERRLGLPVFVDNDASAMALAEFLFGAGRGSKNMMALTLGTGVGGGLVIGGRLFHGSHYSAAEIGHMTIHENGPRCGCGNRGCLETYVGNGYFIKEVKRRLQSTPRGILKSWMIQHKPITPELVAAAARKGDKLSKKMWKDTGEHLGTALAGLANILNPEKIIIGGGVAQAGSLLFNPLKAALKKKAFPIAVRSVRVLPAILGIDAGMIGAAALVLAHPTQKRKIAS